MAKFKGYTMTFEKFIAELQGHGFGMSLADAYRLYSIFVRDLDKIRQVGGTIRLPGFAVLSTRKTEQREVLIAGVKRVVPARQRFAFTPVKATTGKLAVKSVPTLRTA